MIIKFTIFDVHFVHVYLSLSLKCLPICCYTLYRSGLINYRGHK